MKITAVLGSPHKNGNTCTLARWVLDEAERGGGKVEEIFLADKRIEFCRGCISQDLKTMCMSTGKCVIHDDVSQMRDILYQSDGIVLASPAYGMLPTARMKNFLVDRIGMYTAYTSGLGNKYFLGISTAGGIGAKKVARGLADHFLTGFHQRSYLSGYLYAHMGYKHVRECPELELKARFLGKKLVNDIRRKKKYPFQKLPSRILNNLLVRKIILKNIYENRDGQLKAVYQDLKKRKLLAG
jgi:multimeric flavodoxin WrbA